MTGTHKYVEKRATIEGVSVRKRVGGKIVEEHMFYDMGVIGYCGLSTDAAIRGFHQQLEALVDRENLDPIHVRDARNRALTMVEWEWDNRGLGGFRGWCRDEGEAAVKRFSD